MAKVNIQSISASSRWLKCTASLLYNKDFKSNINTLKGNLIHEVSALRLKEIFFKENHSDEIERLKTSDYVDNNDKSLITRWDNDCEKTHEGYINYAIKMYKQYEPHTVEIEKKINLTWYGFKKYGFIDLVMISDDYTIIIDLKSGRTKVESEDNSQMLMYAIGKIQEEQAKKSEFNGRYIISICQSLVNNVKAYEYSLNQISRFYSSHAKKMEEILFDRLQYDPSETACKWCDHRANCNERIKKGVV